MATLAIATLPPTRPTVRVGAGWAGGTDDYSKKEVKNVPLVHGVAASVVGVNSHVTTYAVSCYSAAATGDCEIKKPWTLIQGPNTFSLTGQYTAAASEYVSTVTVDRDFKCSFTSSSLSPSCVFKQLVTGIQAGASYSSATSTTTTTRFNLDYRGMMITAGYEKLPATTATNSKRTTHSATTAHSTTKTHSTSSGAAARALVTGKPLGAIAAVAIGAMF